MKAIIPTGGRGTRMQPVTFSANKHFIPVANKPLIFYPIETVANVGIKDVLITYNPGFLKAVKSILGNGRQWGLNFTYVLQEEPKGLANIFQVCEKDLKGSDFFLHLGDNIFVEGIQDLVDCFQKEKPEGLVARVKHPENWRLGVPVFDRQGRLKDYIEKPQKPPNPYGIPGIYFFKNIVFKCFRGKGQIQSSARGEYEISEPYRWLIKHGYKVLVREYQGKWLDPGKFDDWLEANRFLLDYEISEQAPKVDKSVKIEGRVEIGKNTKIKNSRIRGPVRIGDNVKINGAYIGPFSSIYHGCKLDDCQITNSILMEAVTISQIQRDIDSSIIGSGSEIKRHNHTGDQLELFIGAKAKIMV